MLQGIFDSINQDKGFMFGLINNAISYQQSKSAQARAYWYARALQDQQYDLQQKGYRESYGNIRTGLESAGYNPMLAVQSSAPNTAVSGGTPVQSNAPVDPNLSGSALDIARLNNETTQTDSTVQLNKANARSATAEAISKEIHNQYLNEREEKELGQIGAETDKLIRETSYYDQLAENMEAQRRLQELGINMDYAGRVYAANKSYNASTYATDVNAETARGIRTDKLPFGIGSTYYDLRGKDSRMRSNDTNNRKYWRNYYY